jgi:hypothetical protein
MMRYPSILLMLVANPALADFLTNSRFGIDSTVTGLDGTGIQIGQAEGSPLGIDEGGRSGKAGYDDAAHSASNTTGNSSSEELVNTFANDLRTVLA